MNFNTSSITIIDFSHLSMRNLFVAISQSKDYKQNYKHMIFNSLQMLKNKFRNEIVLAIDGRNNWRKQFYNEYKAQRVKSREISKIDFNEFFKMNDEIIEVIKNNFPFKVVFINEEEADDIAGVVVNNYINNKNITLVTSDKDWMQVQINKNIKIFDPIKNKFKELEEFQKEILKTEFGDILRFTVIHALLGDSGDNIPSITGETEFSNNFKSYLKENNIYSTDVTEIKKLNIYKELIDNYKIFKKYISGKKKGKNKDEKDIFKVVAFGEKKAIKITEDINKLNTFLNSHKLYKDNFKRNLILVDFKRVPKEIKEKILIEFNKAKINYNYNGMINYFMNENLSQHISGISKFQSQEYTNKSSLDDFF